MKETRGHVEMELVLPDERHPDPAVHIKTERMIPWMQRRGGLGPVEFHFVPG